MSRVSHPHLVFLLISILLTVLPAAACGANPPAAVAVNPTAVPATPPPTAVPTATAAPTMAPTKTAAPTEVPATETPEPTAVPELGQVNDANEWWDGTGWQPLPGEGWQVSVDAQTGVVTARDANGAEYTLDAESGQWVKVEQEVAVGSTRVNPDTQITEVYVGNNIYLEAPAHYKPEYVTTTEAGAVYYDAPGLHLYVNETGEWQVRPFEEVPMNGFEVMYGAGGEYTITSDTAKAEERRREFFVSWVQSAGNQDYRQEIFGTTTPSDDQVWQYLQEHGLVVTDSFTTPHYDTNHFMYQISRFAGNEVVGTSIDVNQLGLILVMENEWNSDRHGIQTRVEAMRSASGKLDDRHTPIQLKFDDNGRVFIVSVNKGFPIEYQGTEFYPALETFGGYDSTPQVEDGYIVSSHFESLLNVMKMWAPGHTKEYWLFGSVITVEEFNSYGLTQAAGSYGAFEEQIRETYGNGNLIEPVR